MSSYRVKEAVCDWGLFDGDELLLVLNYRKNADKILEILEQDIKELHGEAGGTTELINPVVMTLMKAFPRSFINYNSEFVVDSNTNQFFRLDDCHSELDIKCKVLEWLSRAACKTRLSHSERKNRELQNEMRNCINEYLGTDFTVEDMRTIYTKLGNACNHEKTIDFIYSGYDMRILEVSE